MPFGHGIEESSHLSRSLFEESSHLSRSLSPNRFNNQALIVELDDHHRSLTPQPVRNSQPFLTPVYNDGSRSSSQMSISENTVTPTTPTSHTSTTLTSPSAPSVSDDEPPPPSYESLYPDVI